MSRTLKVGLYKIKIHFFPHKGNYYDSITPCNISSKPEELGDYYLDFRSKAHLETDFTPEGIPLTSGFYQEKINHPVVVAQFALGSFAEYFRTGEKKYYDEFFRQTDWLLNNHSTEHGFAGWPLIFNDDHLNLKAPWYSAMIQGEAISALSRAYKLTGNLKYLNLANDVLKIFDVTTDKKGVLNYYDGFSVYEEYPSGKLNFVLNGFIFCLYGLYDLSLLGNKKAEQLYSDGVRTLRNFLHLFDTGYWSQYHLFDMPSYYLASHKYHLIHIEQLKTMYFLTGDKYYMDTAEKWKGYSENILTKSYALFRKLMSRNF